MNAPGGYGPWFCAFIVNTATRPKKYTHIVAHTLPHLVVDALNKGASDEDCWIMLFKIGPFTHWTDSIAFLNQWLNQTRGKTRRMERGLELFAQYRDQFRLCLWSQTRPRDEALRYFHNEQSNLIIPPPVVATTAPQPAFTTALSGEQQYREWLEETRALFTQPDQPTLGMIRSRVY